MPPCCAPGFGITPEALYFVAMEKDPSVDTVMNLGLCVALQTPKTVPFAREVLSVFTSMINSFTVLKGFLGFLGEESAGSPSEIMDRCESSGIYSINGGEFRTIAKTILEPRAEKKRDYNRACGTLICALATHLLRHQVKSFACPQPDLLYLRRLRRVLEHCSGRCTYERSGDKYVHDALRSKLDAWRSALMPLTMTPYDEFAEQYADAANATGRNVIETDTDTKFLNVKWSSMSDTAGFHFLVGVLRETLDGVETRVLSNANVSKCAAEHGCVSQKCPRCQNNGNKSSHEPTFVVFDAGFDIGTGQSFGVHCGEHILLPSGNPHLTAIWTFLLLLSAPSAKALITACVSPHDIPPTSSLYEISESLADISV